jgi:organic hydroperoxide reductase OsmC/OhrA
MRKKSDRERIHKYPVTITWTGDLGTGTSAYNAYSRGYVIGGDRKPAIPGSADPVFRGERTRWNPEELLVASLSACHQLWVLHLCAYAGIIVTGYVDHAEGTMAESADGGGGFTHVLLRPHVTVAYGTSVERATELHHEAHAKCFISNSVNFPVEVEPRIYVAPKDGVRPASDADDDLA